MQDFHQQLDEIGYHREMEVSFADCGPTREMRLSAILGWMAVYAGFDYDARGFTYAHLLEMRQAFLLSRLSLQLHHCPSVGDVLSGSTWEDGAKGPNFHRIYRFSDQEGRLCWTAKTDWILVDPITRKILRPAQFTLRPIHPCGVELDCPEPKKLRLPPEAQLLEERQVRWSDLDGNGHLFSGTYGDWIWDALPEELQRRTPRCFFLNYQHEALPGETLQLSGVQKEEGYFLGGSGPAGPCFTAEIQF